MKIASTKLEHEGPNVKIGNVWYEGDYRYRRGANALRARGCRPGLPTDTRFSLSEKGAH